VLNTLGTLTHQTLLKSQECSAAHDSLVNVDAYKKARV
jgi:hypothetical protein